MLDVSEAVNAASSSGKLKQKAGTGFGRKTCVESKPKGTEQI